MHMISLYLYECPGSHLLIQAIHFWHSVWCWLHQTNADATLVFIDALVLCH